MTKSTAQAVLKLVKNYEKIMMSCMSEYVGKEDPRSFLQGTEFELEWTLFPRKPCRREAQRLYEADFEVKAIWLVNPRSRGMIADDDVDTLWRFCGFPVTL